MVQELKEYRRAGIRTFADAEVYDADRKRKSTVQPTPVTAPPGSLPRNWQYGIASADSSLQVILPTHLHLPFEPTSGCFVGTDPPLMMPKKPWR